jgi:hypothetical protein
MQFLTSPTDHKVAPLPTNPHTHTPTGSLAVWQLLLQCLASGIGGGMIGTYLFLFARDIGAVPTLMGVLLMANCAAEGGVRARHAGAKRELRRTRT